MTERKKERKGNKERKRKRNKEKKEMRGGEKKEKRKTWRGRKVMISIIN